MAVLATLKNVKVPEALEVEMQGEALFNDGIGIVLFTVLVAFAAGSGGEATSAGGVAKLLLQEAGGGLVLGVATGYVAYRAMRAIDDFPVEVLITLALVAGTYALAQKLHFSGPLAVVAAGLLVGDRAPRDAMSEETQGYVSSLWTLIDEVLNSVLFLLIGLEVLVLRFQAGGLVLAACAVPIVLVARLAAVSTPLLAFRWGGNLSPRNVAFLTWAGVRGGISVALALSVPRATRNRPSSRRPTRWCSSPSSFRARHWYGRPTNSEGPAGKRRHVNLRCAACRTPSAIRSEAFRGDATEVAA